jgi:hypothetical protein
MTIAELFLVGRSSEAIERCNEEWERDAVTAFNPQRSTYPRTHAYKGGLSEHCFICGIPCEVHR